MNIDETNGYDGCGRTMVDKDGYCGHDDYGMRLRIRMEIMDMEYIDRLRGS